MAIKTDCPTYMKHIEGTFTSISHEIIDLIRDAYALRIYVYMISRPLGHEISERHIMEHFGIKRDVVRLALDYLKPLGLLNEFEKYLMTSQKD